MIGTMDLMKNLVITIDDKVVGGVVGLTSEVNSSTTKINEYMCGNSYGVTSENVDYTLTLTLASNHNTFPHNEFTLKLNQSNYTVMYYNCKILGEREYTKDGFVYRELLITSSERRSFNE